MKRHCVLALAVMLIFSCSEDEENNVQHDPCDNVNCNNGGICINGNCQCQPGWTGTYCDSVIDPCALVNCSANATCVNGQCQCIAGYEGVDCDIFSYEKYIGSYNVSENCTTTFSGFVNQFYTSGITPASRIDVITINNFANRGLTLEATIIDETHLLIPDQNPGALEVSGGEGLYELGTNRIRFEYSYTVSGNFHSCTAIFTRL